MGGRRYQRKAGSYKKFEKRASSLQWDSFYQSFGGGRSTPKIKTRIARVERLSKPKPKRKKKR